MRNQSRAFSLIELLVVITIVGILAAVAVPSYRNYQINAKFAIGMNVVMSQAEKALIYIQKNQSFTSVAQIGLTPDPGNAMATRFPDTNSEYFAPYVPMIIFGGYNPVNPGVMCAHLVSSAYVSNYYGNDNTFADEPLPFASILMYTYEKNGVYQNLCYFNASQADGSPDPNIHYAGCANLSNANEAAQFSIDIADIYTCTQ